MLEQVEGLDTETLLVEEDDEEDGVEEDGISEVGESNTVP